MNFNRINLGWIANELKTQFHLISEWSRWKVLNDLEPAAGNSSALRDNLWYQREKVFTSQARMIAANKSSNLLFITCFMLNYFPSGECQYLNMKLQNCSKDTIANAPELALLIKGSFELFSYKKLINKAPEHCWLKRFAFTRDYHLIEDLCLLNTSWKRVKCCCSSLFTGRRIHRCRMLIFSFQSPIDIWYLLHF